ncbi:MAG: hypothetical protein QOK31_1228 [Solirubrobacteraceae bacterium]|jgi:multisubunit Na+/H+ antiporter MnhG subunit|nr:hypothetical protein [Solirubrobacteraceae bacterium]
MTVGASLILIAVGAILRFAVNKRTIADVDVPTVGLILLVVGVIGLIISLLYMFVWADRRRGYVEERPVVRDPRDRY